MTLYVETDENVNDDFPFDREETARKVAEAVLDSEQCPYECQINVLLTDNAGIRELNRRFREIDRETDVLSFPNLEFTVPADFGGVEEACADVCDPDSGELVLGDIILSVDRIRSQAQEYGHSTLREFAFLVAHSMLHLCGYDHMEPADAQVMEAKQEAVLKGLGITRDGKESDE